MAGAPADPVPAPPLRLAGIRRSWENRTVIADGTLVLDPGAVAALEGANGSGKTTLLRIAAGLLTPDAGQVSLLGLDPSRERSSYQRLLGWLPAGNGGIYNRLTVRQNLEYWTTIALVPASERPGLISQAIEHFNLERLHANRADRISMGERQRLRLAMTFVHLPRVVLLDEPHTSLDRETLALLQVALERLAAGGGGAIWCAPDHRDVRLPFTAQYRVTDGRVLEC
jgi:ABC-2 type transport system ATP-binding protein